MINPLKITDCLVGVIGFKQDLDASLPKPTGTNAASSSGIYVSHPLITMENIIAVIQRNNNTVNEALLNTYLSQKLSQGAVNLAHAIFKRKNLQEQAKTVLGDGNLYSGSGNIYNTIPKKDRFVGFIVNPKENDISVLINKIGLQLNLANPELKIYLYHSSQREAIKDWSLNYTREFSFEWLSVATEILSRIDFPDGHYYIGYYEADLTGNAIERKTKLAEEPCDCEPNNYLIHQKRLPYLAITPFYVETEDLDPDKYLWDESKEVYTDDQNWGMNLQFSIQCDVTSIFCNNKLVLANALALQVAVDILGDMAYSTRNNTNKEFTQQLANFALDNRENNTPGLEKKLEKEIEQMSFNFSSLNPICLPCDAASQQVTFSSVYS